MTNKFISFIAGALLLLGVDASFATGTVGPDPVQTGTLNYTATTTTFQTNTFPFPFTTAPVLQTFAVTTNAVPITNIFATSTNFAVSVNATNSTVAWTAFVGYPRVQSGSYWQTNSPAGVITNTFPTPFALAPTVLITGSVTNCVVGGIPCVTNITPTNFVVLGYNTNQFIQWQAVGVGFAPGSYNPNAPSITY